MLLSPIISSSEENKTRGLQLGPQSQISQCREIVLAKQKFAKFQLDRLNPSRNMTAVKQLLQNVKLWNL